MNIGALYGMWLLFYLLGIATGLLIAGAILMSLPTDPTLALRFLV